ncbi:hypothetical protein SNEBB_011370 [Seison nebaliae]|nr:hypothetical protein SNEBB_011370 [Seison nebaliae]
MRRQPLPSSTSMKFNRLFGTTQSSLNRSYHQNQQQQQQQRQSNYQPNSLEQNQDHSNYRHLSNVQQQQQDDEYKPIDSSHFFSRKFDKQIPHQKQQEEKEEQIVKENSYMRRRTKEFQSNPNIEQYHHHHHHLESERQKQFGGKADSQGKHSHKQFHDNNEHHQRDENDGIDSLFAKQHKIQRENLLPYWERQAAHSTNRSSTPLKTTTTTRTAAPTTPKNKMNRNYYDTNVQFGGDRSDINNNSSGRIRDKEATFVFTIADSRDLLNLVFRSAIQYKKNNPNDYQSKKKSKKPLNYELRSSTFAPRLPAYSKTVTQEPINDESENDYSQPQQQQENNRYLNQSHNQENYYNSVQQQQQQQQQSYLNENKNNYYSTRSKASTRDRYRDRSADLLENKSNRQLIGFSEDEMELTESYMNAREDHNYFKYITWLNDQGGNQGANLLLPVMDANTQHTALADHQNVNSSNNSIQPSSASNQNRMQLMHVDNKNLVRPLKQGAVDKPGWLALDAEDTTDKLIIYQEEDPGFLADPSASDMSERFRLVIRRFKDTSVNSSTSFGSHRSTAKQFTSYFPNSDLDDYIGVFVELTSVQSERDVPTCIELSMYSIAEETFAPVTQNRKKLIEDFQQQQQERQRRQRRLMNDNQSNASFMSHRSRSESNLNRKLIAMGKLFSQRCVVYDACGHLYGCETLIPIKQLKQQTIKCLSQNKFLQQQQQQSKRLSVSFFCDIRIYRDKNARFQRQLNPVLAIPRSKLFHETYGFGHLTDTDRQQYYQNRSNNYSRQQRGYNRQFDDEESEIDDNGYVGEERPTNGRIPEPGTVNDPITRIVLKRDNYENISNEGNFDGQLLPIQYVAANTPALLAPANDNDKIVRSPRRLVSSGLVTTIRRFRY